MKPNRASIRKETESTKPGANSARFRRHATSDVRTAVSPEVTADDVVGDLLALFMRLGLDAGHLIDHLKRMDRASSAVPPPLIRLSAICDLLTLWHQDPTYLDSAGNPAPIKMDSGRNSFRRVAKMAIPNVPATQLLRELVRLRAVRVDSKGVIHVRMRSLSIYEDKRLAALHTLNSLRGFINTLHHNLESAPANSAQLFHRIAWNGEFDKQKIPQLKIWLRRHGQSLLESVDIWMMNHSNARSGKRPNRAVRASVGLYLAVDD